MITPLEQLAKYSPDKLENLYRNILNHALSHNPNQWFVEVYKSSSFDSTKINWNSKKPYDFEKLDLLEFIKQHMLKLVQASIYFTNRLDPSTRKQLDLLVQELINPSAPDKLLETIIKTRLVLHKDPIIQKGGSPLVNNSDKLTYKNSDLLEGKTTIKPSSKSRRRKYKFKNSKSKRFLSLAQHFYVNRSGIRKIVLENPTITRDHKTLGKLLEIFTTKDKPSLTLRLKDMDFMTKAGNTKYGFQRSHDGTISFHLAEQQAMNLIMKYFSIHQSTLTHNSTTLMSLELQKLMLTDGHKIDAKHIKHTLEETLPYWKNSPLNTPET